MAGRSKMTLLACLCATVAGCGGGDGTIPKTSSDQLLSQLEALQSDVENGRCDLVDGHAGELTSAANSLPDSVDPEVRQGVIQATAQIVALSNDPDQCTSTSGASGPTDATSSTSSVTPTTSSTTTDTTTEEETTTDETTGQTDTTDEGNQGAPPETPPGQDEQGGSNGNGLGNGGSASGGISGGKRP